MITQIQSSAGILANSRIKHHANCKPRGALNNTKAIMFLSTPHSGSDISNYVKYLSNVYRASVTVDELESHHPQLRSLNTWFRNNCGKIGINIEVLFEKEPTFSFMVVNETSADPGIVGVVPIPVDADHDTICKPTSKSHLVFARARLLVENCIGS